MTTGRDLGIWYRDVDASTSPAAQATERIALAAAMGSVLVVTVDAPELLANVGAAVVARAVR